MNPNCKYEVHTHWGWFRLDEGAYLDYLAGKLWITWVPGNRQTSMAASDEPPVHISAEAKSLMEKAERDGILSVVRNIDPLLDVPMPCRDRMREITIEELPLSVRAANGLRRAGIHTYGQLQAASDREPGLFAIRNLGRKSVLEIRSTFLYECYCRLLPYEKGEFWEKLLACSRDCPI